MTLYPREDGEDQTSNISLHYAHPVLAVGSWILLNTDFGPKEQAEAESTSVICVCPRHKRNPQWLLNCVVTRHGVRWLVTPCCTAQFQEERNGKDHILVTSDFTVKEEDGMTAP